MGIDIRLGEGAAAATLSLNIETESRESGKIEASGWPRPDPAVLGGGRQTPPLLPLEHFGPWMPWLDAAGEATGAPRDYVAGALLAALAALIGGSRSVSPWEGWVEPAVLWIGLVGDPSSGKSPAADPVLAALRDLERVQDAAFRARYADWCKARDAARLARAVWERRATTALDLGALPPEPPPPAPAAPQRPRLLVNDASTEALAGLLAANPNGLLHHRDEIAGLLGQFDRRAGDRALWIEAYGARAYTIDRVRRGDRIEIPRLALSLFGGIQPDLLAHRLLAGDDDGLAARFLWVWPETAPTQPPGRNTDSAFIGRAFARLFGLRDEANAPRVLRLDDAAAQRFRDWRAAHHRDTARGRLGSALGKLPGVVLRLALTLEHAAWAAGNGPAPAAIGGAALAAAAALADGYFKPMTRRVYSDTALPQAQRDAATLAHWLRGKRASSFNARGLRQVARLPGLRDAAAMNDALLVLLDAGWVRPAPARAGDWPGRYRMDYQVNPAIKRGEV